MRIFRGAQSPRGGVRQRAGRDGAPRSLTHHRTPRRHPAGFPKRRIERDGGEIEVPPHCGTRAKIAKAWLVGRLTLLMQNTESLAAKSRQSQGADGGQRPSDGRTGRRRCIADSSACSILRFFPSSRREPETYDECPVLPPSLSIPLRRCLFPCACHQSLLIRLYCAIVLDPPFSPRPFQSGPQELRDHRFHGSVG